MLTSVLKVAAVGATSTVLPIATSVCPLIHYCDFDTLNGSDLAYTGVKTGSIPADFTLKQNGVAYAPYTIGGTFGFDRAVYSSSGTMQGSTTSFWFKVFSAHTACADFFENRSGRFEWDVSNPVGFHMYTEVCV